MQKNWIITLHSGKQYDGKVNLLHFKTDDTHEAAKKFHYEVESQLHSDGYILFDRETAFAHESSIWVEKYGQIPEDLKVSFMPRWYRGEGYYTDEETPKLIKLLGVFPNITIIKAGKEYYSLTSVLV